MKKVVLVNDLSGLGRCSLGAAIPVFSCLKLQVLPVATAVLTNQTAYPDYRVAELSNHIADCRAIWSVLGVGCDGMVAGFFRSASQVRDALELFDKIKNQGAPLIVDPVMGDDGARYSSFDDELCDAITLAAQKADIITPNFTEACLLSGTDYHALTAQRNSRGYLDTVKDSFAPLLDGNKAAAVVTGIRHSSGGTDSIYNMLLTANGASFSKNDAREGTFSGAGDLFTAVFAGLIINGKDMPFAFDAASRFVAKAIDNTSGADRREGLDFEPVLSALVNLI